MEGAAPCASATRTTPGAFSALSVNQGFESYPTDPESDSAPTPSDDPPRQAAEVFIQLLEDRGVDVQGGADAAVAPLPPRFGEATRRAVQAWGEGGDGPAR